MGTEKYRKKRDFRKTTEPKEGGRRAGEKPIFVIQKHDAGQRHYDFRIEVNGVLKSRVLPKGPSTDPREKRLMIPTEDHPPDYADFEGVIPEDEYGGGVVLIWDRGTYYSLKEENDDDPPDMEQSLAAGHVVIHLNGQKIRGGYALIRTGKTSRDNWLLIKIKDSDADARRNSVNTEPKSAASGRTLAEIKRGEG